MSNIKISTTLGDIVVRLYDETPLHRDNFLKLATTGYYDNVLFHRVIKDFMIQGGDPNSKEAVPGAQYGTGGPDYTIEAEIKPELIPIQINISSNTAFSLEIKLISSTYRAANYNRQRIIL